MNSEDRKKIHELTDQIIDLLERNIIKNNEIENISNKPQNDKDYNLSLPTDHVVNIIVEAIESARKCLLSQDG